MPQEARAWKQMEQTWLIESRAISALPQVLEREAVLRCMEVLATCRGRIITAGVGTSGAAARKIAHSLCCVDLPSFFLSPDDSLHGGLGAVSRKDVAILLSRGGKTREITDLVAPLRAKGAFIIAVTENRSSALARGADLVLTVRIEREADRFDMLATTSTLAVVALFDAICVALMARTRFTASRFALIHPGGAVGERLRGRKRRR